MIPLQLVEVESIGAEYFAISHKKWKIKLATEDPLTETCEYPQQNGHRIGNAKTFNGGIIICH